METYTVGFGNDSMTLSQVSEVMGNTNLTAVNELFSVNITELTPFTTYYYNISASNSLGTTTTSVMNFTTDETGTVTFYNIIPVIIVVLLLHSSSFSSSELQKY